MSKEYEIQKIYSKLFEKKINSNEEIVCEVTDHDDYSRHLVKAKIRNSPPTAGEDTLWLRDHGGDAEGPWTINILEELDPEEVKFEPETGHVSALKSYGGR